MRIFKDLMQLILDLLSKDLLTIETNPLSYTSYFGFLAILEASSLKILSDSVLLVKSF